MACGGPLFGFISDKYGRRTALYSAVLLISITNFMTSASWDYWSYFCWRAVSALAVQGIPVASVAITTELVGPDYRGRVGIACQACFILGECALALLAYCVRDWRALCFWCAACSAVLLPTALLVPESPRWLLSKGQGDRALQVLRRIAYFNNGTVPEGVHLQSCGAADKAEVEDPYDSETMPLRSDPAKVSASLSAPHGSKTVPLRLDPAKGSASPAVLQSIQCGTSGAGTGGSTRDCSASHANFFGLSFALSTLSGDPYLNFFLLALAEIPSVVITLFIDHVGRVLLLVAGLTTAAISCCFCGIAGGSWIVVFASGGKLGAAAAGPTLIVYANEVVLTI
eukprot:gene25983-11669_t